MCDIVALCYEMIYPDRMIKHPVHLLKVIREVGVININSTSCHSPPNPSLSHSCHTELEAL